MEGMNGLIPRPFSGSDDGPDVREWLTEVAAWINMRKLDVVQSMAGIRFLLRSEAKLFYDSLSEQNKNTFEGLKKAFIDHYERDSGSWKKFNRVLEYKQSVGQPFQEFYVNY